MLTAESLRAALERGGHALPDAIAEQIQRNLTAGDYGAAAELAASAFSDGCVDIRCITAMLMGLFIGRGPVSIPIVFSLLCYSLDQGWAALEPKHRKDQSAEGACSQLLRNTKTTLDFHEAARDTVWESWRESMSEHLSEDCGRTADELDHILNRLSTVSRTAVALAALRAKISASFEHAPRHTAPGNPRDALLPAQSTDMSSAAESTSHGAQPNAVTTTAIDCDEPAPTAYLEISAELASLIERIEAFAQLAQRGDLTRAAIVAHDIRRTIETFDPVRFLPSLFARHFQLLSSKIDSIASVWEQEGSPTWQALAQHYRTDLKGFVTG
jgi:hypothetical protein